MITIKTLDQHSAQEVFDQAVNHLLTQNKQCKKDFFTCVYRNKEGLKCVAGCFISDEEYDKRIEGDTWTGIDKKFKKPSIHDVMIEQLQDIHDNESVAQWPIALYKFSVENNLIFNEPPRT